MILRAGNIDTLIVIGNSIRGVNLSTVCYTAHADYRLVVVEDDCADRDTEMDQLLMEKGFPRQAVVVSSHALVSALAR